MTLPPIASTSNWRRSPAFGTPSPPPPTLHPPNLPSEPSLSPAQSHSELSGSSSHDSDGDTEMNEASEGEGDAETAPRQGKGKGKGEPKKHVCMICSRRFNRPSSLRIHGNTHSGAMPFSCPHPGCGRAFNVKSNMRRHLRNHTSEPEDASGTMLLFHNTYHSSSGLSTSLPTPLAGTATVGVTPYVDAAFSAQAALSAKRLANRSQPQFLPASPSPPVAVEAERSREDYHYQSLMIATLAMASSINSNSAGGPLPILPRRAPLVARSSSYPSSRPTPPPIKLVVQHATPPSDDESSTSTSDDQSVITIHSKRSRGVRPPEESTPLPFPARRPPSPPDEVTPRPSAMARPLVYSPGAGSISGLRALSTPTLPSLAPRTSKSTQDDTTPRVIRKKSGEPLKSSLKSSTPRVRGSLEVVINGGSAVGSKSAPTTPTSGARARVHFNSQLEQVKLFLAEQKPLAVSRDGSPTDDTSGTEDFPDYIFGRDAQTDDEGALEMTVEVPPPGGELDVKLQTLVLTEDKTGVAGTVAVRNLAFDKWVAVRFTLDEWQTTSEVTARYSHSLPGGMVDVFAFTIRLNDILARIDGKQMALAVRFNAAGREMWDNNRGRNYMAVFKRVRGGCEQSKRRSGEVAADLRTRLERVVKMQEQQETPTVLRGNQKVVEPPAAVGFRNGDSLAARYDFNSSSRDPWRPHQRAQSHPNLDSPSPPHTSTWPRSPAIVLQKPRSNLGSPRDVSDDINFRPSLYITSPEDHPFAVPKPSRQHQRGYFDVPLRDPASLRRTPPGTPRFRDLTPIGNPGRYNSFPPLDARGVGLGLDVAGMSMSREGNTSEDSTPSFISSDGSTSGTTSPISPPDLVTLESRLAMTSEPESSSTYHNFLDKFCFYTGATSVEPIQRTHSASSVEELLSTSSPRSHGFASTSSPLLRFDDSSSGSSTPTTARSISSPTPVVA
ncbi:CBM21 domain-containing protein [Mycena indigotica]|uniref:CBM21 domain-containing protein n=1 Tax=Mycena indigotica TaxID=2126181 RepID=A0A8H6SA49_9AGAR|nr:CBM21 domain-containing protein [Mycena indigotica]KAF7294582.1 CBM21 domain-containing protein [Mycena indigotica]